MGKRNLLRKGFIDPISIIGLGFLVVTLVLGTAVVNKKDINLDFVKRASRIDVGDIDTGSSGTVSNSTITQTADDTESKADLRQEETNHHSNNYYF